MNPPQRKILIAIIAYALIWNTKYWWEYLPGLFDLGIILLLLITLIVLILTGLYQAYQYVSGKNKVPFRLVNIALIALISILTCLYPLGLIDFEQLEGKNILYARREGVANCTTSIRLKAGNRFKKTVICFGTDHYWGDYEIVKDTIKFHYDRISGPNQQNDFAVMQLSKDTSGKNFGLIQYYSEGFRGIPMAIVHAVDAQIIETDLRNLKMD